MTWRKKEKQSRDKGDTGNVRGLVARTQAEREVIESARELVAKYGDKGGSLTRLKAAVDSYDAVTDR